ncbi:peptidoglycan DD-metalloendopeptidase family protein [Hymenobacter taeanensis]|uniref:Peptidoglycan DD-metalloendopeptidase family protein n=1 Tax=Hymenobacter taeanensis TaxID=2735321 RepID=A0A6M6BL25_9BACT|nr:MULTISPECIES: M23 family metallopeptidase [Hymenobacter]QJX48669.1 peptidoglycan DD-metalloendopeptidase family protein [Hymenobacter taeanensis]UOQ81831.1 M23 family metallopeptidase [Hymenobacter sp. 5414T-23]
MPKFLAFALGISLLVFIRIPALCQAALYKIYQVKNENGTVSIMGENHGVVPVSVLLEAKLVLMHSTVALPARIALPPAESPQLLTVFVPEALDPYYRYTYNIDPGVYTGHAPDSSLVYALPFRVQTDTIKIRRQLRNQYPFALPVGTPIVAAREGIVAFVRHDKKNALVRKNGNVILVYHADGTQGRYENITQNSAVVQVGQQVKQGELLGYFGGNKYEPHFWFVVVYLTKLGLEAAPVTFNDKKE